MSSPGAIILFIPFPILDQERDYEKLLSGEMPPLYRIRFHAGETSSAIYFNPGWTRLPVQAYRPFYIQGQMVTPFYGGNHLPLARENGQVDVFRRFRDVEFNRSPRLDGVVDLGVREIWQYSCIDRRYLLCGVGLQIELFERELTGALCGFVFHENSVFQSGGM